MRLSVTQFKIYHTHKYYKALITRATMSQIPSRAIFECSHCSSGNQAQPIKSAEFNF